MLKYIGNIFNTILPSVLATVIGAYIVNHYVLANRPETPPAAASSASAPEAKKADEPSSKNASGETRAVMAPADGEAGKGKAEKSDKSDKSDKPAARASQSTTRDKATADKADKADKTDKADKNDKTERADKGVPAKATAPVASSVAAPSVEPVSKEERRDAADLARAAIERLRSSNEVTRGSEPHPLEVPRQELPRAEQRLVAPPPSATVAVDAPVAPAPAVVPAPPPATMAAPIAPMAPVPPTAGPAITSSVPSPPEPIAAAPHREEASRLTPPAEIPGGRRSDADAGRSVGDDVLSAAQSVIHAVIPR